MKVALFVPCYIDQFYPRVGIATIRLLEQQGCEVVFPEGQTCCGQPMANSGCEQDALASYRNFVTSFAEYEYIVAPSGSCTYHVRHHYDKLPQTPEVVAVRQRTYDLAEFLIDVLQVSALPARFPHRVGLHLSCHGLRGLRLGSGSERQEAPYSKLAQLLKMVEGLELVELDRADECCGFGGTFAVNEAAISVKMGKDRLQDHLRHDAEVITAGDMSCLMHLEGIARRRELPVRILHIAEILSHQE